MNLDIVGLVLPKLGKIVANVIIAAKSKEMKELKGSVEEIVEGATEQVNENMKWAEEMEGPIQDAVNLTLEILREVLENSDLHIPAGRGKTAIMTAAAEIEARKHI